MVLALEIPMPDRNVWPESPQAARIREVMIPAPSLLTGSTQFDVPIYNIVAEGVSIPLALKYRSNGIKVWDDPHPIGYGWSLTPPLRVSRQVMGRPDEYFPFKGEEPYQWFEDEFWLGYQSVTMRNATSTASLDTVNRYDTEHDIFTVYLLDKTLTLVLDQGQFRGVGCDEYRVEGDRRLDYIKVIDPQGIVYNFSTDGEFIEETVMRTEWLLTDITLPSGAKMEFSWQLHQHYNHGPAGFWDCTVIYGNEAPQVWEVSDPTTGVYRKSTQYCNTKDLSSITFPGGSATLTYDSSMLKSIMIKTEAGVPVGEMKLTHDGQQRLLTDITATDGGEYIFEYDPTSFPPNPSVDWWGFYNGGDNVYGCYTPRVLPKTGEGSLFPSNEPIDGLDRSPDATAMKANLLMKAIYPTGAICEWTYEPHRFSAPELYDTTFSAMIDEPALTFGGGLRVESVTLRNGADDQAPQVIRYVYGKDGDGMANVVALPLLSTFISNTKALIHRPWRSGSSLVKDNYMTIGSFSNYLTGQTGVAPIWYGTVTALGAEGKTEYTFSNIIGENNIRREWGKVIPMDVRTAFSTGPQLTSTVVYKTLPAGGFEKVEEINNTYSIIRPDERSSLTNVDVRRAMIPINDGAFQLDWAEDSDWLIFSVPDWIENQGLGYIPVEVYRYGFDWYKGYPYKLQLLTEQLQTRVSRLFTTTGTIERTESYSYIPGTQLLKTKTVTCADQTIVTTMRYAEAQDAPTQATMIEANVTGLVTEVKETVGDNTTGYRVELTGCGGSVFRPQRVYKLRDNTAWAQTDFSYDRRGNITSAVGINDGVRHTWTWDSRGLYPVSHQLGNLTAETAKWKLLVGVSSITNSAGIKTDYSYDSFGRLTTTAVGGKTTARYQYRQGHDGNNSLTTTNMLNATSGVLTVERFDANGRQWATFMQTPQGAVATLNTFDTLGRIDRQYMPVAVSSLSASVDELAAEAESRYSDARPYSQIFYEASPRRLPLSTAKAGDEWSDRLASEEILTNDGGRYICPRYTATAAGVTLVGNYPAGSLKLTRTIDEDGVETEIYEDMRGQKVCRRQGGKTTSYIYDDYGQLRYILPPGVSGTLSRTSPRLRDAAYWYDYDARGLMICKHVPAAGDAYYIYDTADRLVAEHTPNQSQWAWYLYGYDSCGRRVVTIEIKTGRDDAEYWASVVRIATLDATGPQENDCAGYSFTPAYKLPCEAIAAQYFDNYDFISVRGLGEEFRFSDQLHFDSAPSNSETHLTLPRSALTAPSGMLTGIYTGAGHEAYYYDHEGRQIERYATGFNVGRAKTAYTYSGQIACVSREYPAESGLSQLNTSFSYDSCGRPVSAVNTQAVLRPSLGVHPGEAATGIRQTADSAEITTTYNDLGQVGRIDLGRNASVAHAYDVHGWLRSKSFTTPDAALTEQLLYASGAKPRYNGNISARIFDGHRYDYTYDNSNRLTSAAYTGQPGESYSTSYSYDDRSNILSITRAGVVGKMPDGRRIFGELDNIVADYDGNRLVAFENICDDYIFADRAGAGRHKEAEHGYDDAGRLISDSSRGITRIDYNHLGQPTLIQFADDHRHTMTYDGLGNHLSTSFYESTTAIVAGRTVSRYRLTLKRRYYGDGQIVDNDTLVQTHFGGGYFDRSGHPHYYLTDWQGNNIGVVSEAGNLVQRVDYYPYGEPWVRPNGAVNSRLYTGKELVAADGLRDYDFAARRYYAPLAMFTSPDPLCEETPWVSPYTPNLANPIMQIDPTGLRTWNIGLDGYIIDEEDTEEFDQIVLYNNGRVFARTRQYPAGSIESVESRLAAPGSLNHDGPVTMFKTPDAEIADDIYKFFVYYVTDASKIEYVRLKYENLDGNKWWFISTSHQRYSDTSFLQVFNIEAPKLEGYSLKSMWHSHPGICSKPSQKDKELSTILNKTNVKSYVNWLIKLPWLNDYNKTIWSNRGFVWFTLDVNNENDTGRYEMLY